MSAPRSNAPRPRAAAKAAGAAPATGTRPRPTDKGGRELDEWGLPYCGPARQRVLTKRGLPDPNIEPEAWSSGQAGAKTETENG